MEWISTENKNGYSIMHNSAGEEYIVIDGLDPNQVHTPVGLERFMLENFALFAILYWLLLLGTFTYLIAHYLLGPLYRRWAHGRPLFSDEQ